MQRIDRHRIETAPNKVRLTLETRIADLDMQGHVNNGAGITMLQEARARFNSALGLNGLTFQRRALIAGIQVEYVREMHHPAPVEIETAVVEMGRTSFTMGQIARQNGQPTLYGETVVVMADEHGPTELPTDMREGYARHMACS